MRQPKISKGHPTSTPVDILGLSHPLIGPPIQVPFGSLHIDEGRFQIRNSKACSYAQGAAKEAERGQLRNSLSGLFSRP